MLAPWTLSPWRAENGVIPIVLAAELQKICGEIRSARKRRYGEKV
jgi:hypothetical protein